MPSGKPSSFPTDRINTPACLVLLADEPLNRTRGRLCKSEDTMHRRPMQIASQPIMRDQISVALSGTPKNLQDAVQGLTQAQQVRILHNLRCQSILEMVVLNEMLQENLM